MLPKRRTTFQLWAIFTIAVFFFGTMAILYGVDNIRRAEQVVTNVNMQFFINAGTMYLNIGITSMMFMVIYLVFLFLDKEKKYY
jgi:ABC-type polysaccharide/polyol phosphate export permease